MPEVALLVAYVYEGPFANRLSNLSIVYASTGIHAPMDHQTDTDTAAVVGGVEALASTTGSQRYDRLGMGEPKPAAAVHQCFRLVHTAVARQYEQESVTIYGNFRGSMPGYTVALPCLVSSINSRVNMSVHLGRLCS